MIFMSQTVILVKELIKCGGSTAPQMTHSLKVLGQGNMATGLKRFGGYLFSCGYTKGELAGVLKGSLGAISAGVLALIVVPRIVGWMKFQRVLKEEHAEMISALREASTKTKDLSDSSPVDHLDIESDYDTRSGIIEAIIEGGKNVEETI
jgi:uncharacterized membrane protein